MLGVLLFIVVFAVVFLIGESRQKPVIRETHTTITFNYTPKKQEPVEWNQEESDACDEIVNRMQRERLEEQNLSDILKNSGITPPQQGDNL